MRRLHDVQGLHPPFQPYVGWCPLRQFYENAFQCSATGDTGIDSVRDIRKYFIPDFSNWTDEAVYQEAAES